MRLRPTILPLLFMTILAACPIHGAEFLISYWGGPPAAESTEHRYREIADCGFNIAMPPAAAADVATNRKILDACKAAGIKAIIQDPRLDLNAEPPAMEKAIDQIVADYASHPALAGYFITDEPNARLFPALGRINACLLQKDPAHLPYINLFPNGASEAQLGNKTYEEHVSQYIATVKPKLVSWDHYLQMAGNESLYFKNLATVRTQCAKAELPFIQIILSLPHYNYRNPSEADLRWQVYTSLAYGARGIMYFTYWTLPAWNLGDGSGIIDRDGKRDAKYDMVRRINARLKALGPTLMQLESTGVWCTEPLPPGTDALPADAILTRAEGGPLLIGSFKGPKQEPYTMVVNRSFKDKLTARLTFRDTIASAAEISQESGKPLDAAALTNHSIEIPLEPGEGRLFLLSQKQP